MLNLAPFQSFQCHSCGRCCRNSWSVEVEPAALPAITSSGATREKIRQGYIPLVVTASGMTVTGRDEQGACLYLDSASLCELHGELGAQRKPLACQLYPYSITATPDGDFASLSFACPVALWGHDGRHEENHRELEALLRRRGQRGGPLPHQVELVPGRFIPWTSYRDLELALEQRLDRSALSMSMLGSVGALLSLLSHTPSEQISGWQAVQAFPPEDEFEVQLVEMVGASVIALLELPAAPLLRQELSSALLSGASPVGPRHGAVLPSFSLRFEPDQLLGDCLDRYLANALFGKALLSGTVVSRLLLLATGTALVAYYSQVFETLTGNRKEAITRAFELVEAELLTHSRSADPLFASLEATFCQAYGLKE